MLLDLQGYIKTLTYFINIFSDDRDAFLHFYIGTAVVNGKADFRYRFRGISGHGNRKLPVGFFRFRKLSDDDTSVDVFDENLRSRLKVIAGYILKIKKKKNIFTGGA